MLGAFVLGTNMWQMERYYPSFRIAYIIMLANALVVLMRQLPTKYKKWEQIILYLCLAIIICSSSIKNNLYGVSYSITRADVKALQLEIDKVNKNDSNVIIFCGNALYINNILPDIKTYLFRDYTEVEKSNVAYHTGSVYYYKDANNIYRMDNGQTYAGKMRDYKRLVAEMGKNDYIIFWKCDYEKLDEDLKMYIESLNIIGQDLVVMRAEQAKKGL